MSSKYSRSQFSRISNKSHRKRSYWKFKLTIFLILLISLLLFLCKDVEPERGQIKIDITDQVKSGEFK
ncbi:MAG: hypothetical protein ACK5WS_01570 [Alphaproteobacteria bacterium]|nr:hypothetical protein [Candidatus Jidaibacter sp.]